jgi:uncharacterized protein
LQPWRMGSGCVIVRVRLTPKSSKDAIEGVELGVDGAVMRARVRAVPSEGEANNALVDLLARWLGIPKSQLAVSRGTKSRVKTVEISGHTQQIEQRLCEKLAALSMKTPDKRED